MRIMTSQKKPTAERGSAPSPPGPHGPHRPSAPGPGAAGPGGASGAIGGDAPRGVWPPGGARRPNGLSAMQRP